MRLFSFSGEPINLTFMCETAKWDGERVPVAESRFAQWIAAMSSYFGNLTWRSIGTVGSGRIHVRENDTGPDDANHAKFGIYIFDGPGMPQSPPHGARLFDIAPTVLAALGQPVPGDMQGRSLV